MAGTDQPHRRQARSATGLLDPSLCPAARGLAPPEVWLPLPRAVLPWPPARVGPHDLARRPRVPRRHQDFRLVRAEVAPSLLQDQQFPLSLYAQ